MNLLLENANSLEWDVTDDIKDFLKKNFNNEFEAMFQEVREKYPRCYAEVGLWIMKTFGTAHTHHLESYENRDLYDFFDSKKIYCQPSIKPTKFFGFEICKSIAPNEIETIFKDNGSYYNRAEVEKAMFLEAFNYLENLNQPKP